MKKISEPIVFFGSGPVAAESLKALCESFTIDAVVTKKTPDHHLYEAPVVRVAEDRSIKLYSVRDKRELEFLLSNENDLRNIRLGILVDFGIIISRLAIDHFSLGIVNSHFSLLPQWRGADPISFSILKGQPETGVSLMLITEGMDEGPLLAQQIYKLRPDITTPQLTTELIRLSNTMLTSSLPLYLDGRLQPFPQDSSKPPTYSRKLTKEDGVIDWGKDAEEIEREVRAFIEWPKSHGLINGISVILTKTHVEHNAGPAPAGSVEFKDRQLTVHCGTHSLVIDHLKPAGRKEISGPEFVRGYLKLA